MIILWECLLIVHDSAMANVSLSNVSLINAACRPSWQRHLSYAIISDLVGEDSQLNEIQVPHAVNALHGAANANST